MRREPQPSPDVPQPSELLSSLIDIPGSTGETYSRLHRYSPRNLGFLALQGCPPQPVGTYGKWQELGRQVQRGEKAYAILRPIQVKVGGNEGDKEGEEPKLIQRFKVVRALFALSQTKGEELPPYERPDWSVTRALGTLAIERVPFESYDGNIGGYAVGRTIAINPLAPYPLRTTLHEMSHVEHGHTTDEHLEQYQSHRGTYEYEAEASAFVALKELDELDNVTASVSRAYVQGWLRGEQPSETSVRNVLNVSTRILDAGRAKE